MPVKLSRYKLADATAASIKAGDRQAMNRLAAYLVEEHRTNEAELIVRDIEQALVGYGIVLADVTSARALTADARTHITTFIQDDTGADTVTLREHIDPDVIGGMRVSYGDRLLDATVATKLERLA